MSDLDPVSEGGGHQTTLSVIRKLLPVCHHAAGEPPTEASCSEALHGGAIKGLESC